MTRRYMVISADCHAAGRWEDYEPYFERKHLDAFRDWCGGGSPGLRAGEGRLFDSKFLDELDAERAVESGGKSGTWDPARRVRELEADGIVGEVIFPGAESFGVPFQGLRPTSLLPEEQPPELLRAGASAYNRWLSEFCSAYPERSAGVAVLDYHDVDAALEEIRSAKRAGLRGGIFLPAEWGDLPTYNHPRYEPIWAECEELELPVNSHPLGSGRAEYGALPGATAIFLSEVKWVAHRPLTFLLWSGVLERHPRLQLVLTEQQADWVPSTLEYFDDLYTRPIFAQIREGLPLLPSEYWARQCHVGASFMVHKEVAMRREIGLRAVMWGSDYPHAEGTWPHTRERLQEAFAGVPESEVRLMVGENAARVYHFDPAKLAPVVESVGPKVAELS